MNWPNQASFPVREKALNRFRPLGKRMAARNRDLMADESAHQQLVARHDIEPEFCIFKVAMDRMGTQP